MKLIEEYKFLTSVRFKTLKMKYAEYVRMDGEKCRQVQIIINNDQLSFTEQNDELVKLFRTWNQIQITRKERLAQKLKQQELNEIQSEGSTVQQKIINEASKKLKRKELPFEGSGLHKKRMNLCQNEDLKIIDDLAIDNEVIIRQAAVHSIEDEKKKKKNAETAAAIISIQDIVEDDLLISDDDDVDVDCSEYNPSKPATGFDTALNNSLLDEMKKFRMETEKAIQSLRDENKAAMKKFKKDMSLKQSTEMANDLREIKMRIKKLIKKYEI